MRFEKIQTNKNIEQLKFSYTCSSLAKEVHVFQ